MVTAGAGVFSVAAAAAAAGPRRVRPSGRGRELGGEAESERLGKVASLPGTVDYTPYGESRASPQGFYRHYLAAHSHAVVHADALTLLDKASSLCYFFGRNE